VGASRGEYRIQFVANQLLDVGLRIELPGLGGFASMKSGSLARLSAVPQPASATAAPAIANA